MDQPPLFVESVYDALRACVQALGGPKQVAAGLWPAKPIEDARRLLLDCLNPERHEKLDPEQVLLLLRMAREANFHVAMSFIAQECGYRAPEPLDPQDEQAKLVAAIETAGVTLTRALDRLDKLRERAKPMARVA